MSKGAGESAIREVEDDRRRRKWRGLCSTRFLAQQARLVSMSRSALRYAVWLRSPVPAPGAPAAWSFLRSRLARPWGLHWLTPSSGVLGFVLRGVPSNGVRCPDVSRKQLLILLVVSTVPAWFRCGIHIPHDDRAQNWVSARFCCRARPPPSRILGKATLPKLKKSVGNAVGMLPAACLKR